MNKWTISLRLLAHAPLNEHAPLLEYSRTEVNRNIYDIGTPAFSINSQNATFFGYRCMYQKARSYGICVAVLHMLSDTPLSFVLQQLLISQNVYAFSEFCPRISAHVSQ